jgi:hypothetical protein
LLFLLALPAAKAEFRFTSQVGIAFAKSGKVCLAIHRRSFVAGSRITLVLLQDTQSIAEAEVLRPADNACPSPDEGDRDLRRYEIRMLKGSLELSTLAIAVFASSRPFSKHGNSVTADVDGDGTPESFRSCASSEGLHLTVWSGKPLEGKLRWHQYYYLGYDVESDCTAKDIGDK